jgi:hypothetical protein
MIIWSGWGAAIAIAGIVVAGVVTAIFRLVSAGPVATALGVLIGGVLGGIVIWQITRRLEAGPGRTLLDETTGQRVVLRKSAGSLFFIAARYWAFIVPAICLVAAVGALLPPT